VGEDKGSSSCGGCLSAKHNDGLTANNELLHDIGEVTAGVPPT
jgi:hypothetical protein